MRLSLRTRQTGWRNSKLSKCEGPTLTLDEAARLLAQAGIENPRNEARLLLAHSLGVDRSQTLRVPLHQDQDQAYAGLVRRRAAHEPFAYLTARKEFWSMEFHVGPGVLIPRPETETLVEQALRSVCRRDQALRIADLGTGSGAILIAALSEFPNAAGTGFESSTKALAYALTNQRRLMPERATMTLGDWNEASGQFDLIFSNPPYIPTAEIGSLAPEVRNYEPVAALDGGADGLCAYRSLLKAIPRLLKPGGFAFLEIGEGQGRFVEPLVHLRRNDLEISRLAPDLAGVARCLVLVKR